MRYSVLSGGSTNIYEWDVSGIDGLNWNEEDLTNTFHNVVLVVDSTSDPMLYIDEQEVTGYTNTNTDGSSMKYLPGVETFMDLLIIFI